MATTKITDEDRQRYERARAIGEREAQDPSTVIAARYLPDRDGLELEFAAGGVMTIPRRAIHEVADAQVSDLREVTVSPAGDAVGWRTLDVDIYIPGLVERVFGSRMFAASNGRRGGRQTSTAKASAARANGTKGGRPRRVHTA